MFHQRDPPKRFVLPKLAVPQFSSTNNDIDVSPVDNNVLPDFERIVGAIPWQATGADRGLVEGLSALAYLSQDQLLDACCHYDAVRPVDANSDDVPLFALSFPSKLSLYLCEIIRGLHGGQRLNQNDVALLHCVQAATLRQPFYKGEGCVCYRYATTELPPPPTGSLVSFPCLPFATRDPREVFAHLDTANGLCGTLVVIWSRHSGRRVAPHHVHLGADADVVFPLGATFTVLDTATGVAAVERAFGGKKPPKSLRIWALDEVLEV